MAFLADALDSTIGLVNSAGTIATGYTYEPFGNTTVSGPNTNPYQFTGRENDGDGLYYYRARYYSPTLQRFISQDPLGFSGGTTDLYSYAEDDAGNRVDPTGLYTCYYSTQLHTMSCIPDNSLDPSGISNQFVSGNGTCQNNPSPSCQNTFNSGPMPEGDYNVGPPFLTGGYPRHNLTLAPNESLPSNRTGGFKFHGCGNPATCSNGCIAAYPDNPTLFYFDFLFNLEPGSTVHVGP